VLRLARLAVDESPRGQGVGSALLRHVFILALKMSEEYGCVGVLVDAKPDAVDLYERFGFSPLELTEGQLESRPRPTPMFLALELIVRALAPPAGLSRRTLPPDLAAVWSRRPCFRPRPMSAVVFARIPRDHEGPLDRVPELCVEVLSTDRTHDRVTKRLLYAASDVREYWVVEPSGLIERWSGPGLAQAEEVREILTTPLLPGFSLDLAALFAE
jgi:Uma2 family endonuclease